MFGGVVSNTPQVRSTYSRFHLIRILWCVGILESMIAQQSLDAAGLDPVCLQLRLIRRTISGDLLLSFLGVPSQRALLVVWLVLEGARP